MRVNLGYPTPNGPVALVATYPDFFPFFRPEVAAPKMRLTRHQMPNGGNLCLLGRRTSKWFAEESLASVLVEQIPHLLNFEQTGDLEQLADVEERQAEPASFYYNVAAVPGSYVLVDTDWDLGTAQSGSFRIRCQRLIEPTSLGTYVQGFIDGINDQDGNELASWSGPRPQYLGTLVQGQWRRLDQPIIGDINDLRRELGEEEWARLSAPENGNYKRHVTAAALVFPEEVSHQHYADGWAIIMFDHPKAHRGKLRTSRGYFIRSARAGQSDLAARSPALAAFPNATVALFGLGAIGAPVAIELARCGVKKLRLVDGDHMEPSTARRWPIGWPAFARLKAEVLTDRLNGDYPWTEVTYFPEMIGRTAEPGVRRQGETIEEILDGVDLVIDATAEMGVNHLLSEFCRLRKIPFVLANGTPGSWGGMVARFAEGTPCWMCFRTALYGAAAEQLPLPPADEGETGEVQPAGCAEPTFTGAAFDLQEVSLETVRAAASMLSMDGGYDMHEWQYARLTMRLDGRRIPPQWITERIPRRPACSCGAT